MALRVVGPGGLDNGWREAHTLSADGVLTVRTGKSRIYLEGTFRVETVRAAVNMAPAGASIIIDVNKNGTSIYSTVADRPTIAAAGFTSLGGSSGLIDFALGDYFTVDIDQVGSTTAGSDLTVTIRLLKLS